MEYGGEDYEEDYRDYREGSQHWGNDDVFKDGTCTSKEHDVVVEEETGTQGGESPLHALLKAADAGEEVSNLNALIAAAGKKTVDEMMAEVAKKLEEEVAKAKATEEEAAKAKEAEEKAAKCAEEEADAAKEAALEAGGEHDDVIEEEIGTHGGEEALSALLKVVVEGEVSAKGKEAEEATAKHAEDEAGAKAKEAALEEARLADAEAKEAEERSAKEADAVKEGGETALAKDGEETVTTKEAEALDKLVATLQSDASSYFAAVPTKKGHRQKVQIKTSLFKKIVEREPKKNMTLLVLPYTQEK